MKKTFVALGLAIVLLSAVLIWRSLRPTLSDREQIAANLDEIATAADNRSARSIGFYLAKDFTFSGTKKRDFQNQLVGGMFQYRVIDLELHGVDIEIDEETETAKSEGRYSLSLKTEPNVEPNIITGDFELEWRKDDGEWKVTKATGSPVPQ